MIATDAALVIALRHEGALAPWRPLRLEEPPGVALLRSNLAAVRTEVNPTATRLERVAVDPPRRVLGVYDADAADAVRVAGATLARHGVTLTPVRRPDAGTDCVPALLPRLRDVGVAPPSRWRHPLVFSEMLRPGGGSVRVGVVFGRMPEPGMLSLADVGGDGVRADAPPAALPHDVRCTEVPALVEAFQAAGAAGALLVDDGGEVAALADALVARGRLAAWFGPARRPIPRAVVDAGVPVFVWLEPEDEDAPGVAPGRGCAFLPVGLPGEDVPRATARVLALRERGYTAVVPRFFTPVKDGAEWRHLAERFPPRHDAPLDGSHLPFALPGWERARGPELIALWTRQNRPPTAERPLAPARRRTYSLDAIGAALDGYLADRASDPPAQHGRELVAELLAELPAGADGLGTIAEYPFVSWHGESLLALVDGAIDLRLRRVAGAPPELLRAMQDAVLGGGKRIRPILAVVVAVAHGAPMASALAVALAVEWLHAASLVQDDLPAMDDDRVRRRHAATHVRHGEGLALLAADALVALAFEDVAALAEDDGVGPARAAAMAGALARALGVSGLVGGQARDLLARERRPVDAASVLDVHRRKTAPLFELAGTLATTLAGVPAERARELECLLGSMGVAFQIIDDVLDATADNPAFGRPAGSDARHGLPTFASLVGPTAARRRAEQLLEAHLGVAPENGGPGLLRLARFVLDRRS